MKIVLINSLFKPYSRGGAEVIFVNIAQELKKDGHEISVITITDQKDKKEFYNEEVDGLQVYRFYPANIFSFVDIGKQSVGRRLIWHFLDTFNFHSFFQVRKILKQVKPDLVLSHNLKGLGYLTLLAIKSLKIKNIHTLHDVQLVKPSGLLFWGQETESLGEEIYSRINKMLFGSPYAVTAPSRWLLDFYAKRGFFKNSRKIVLANPLVLPENNPVKEPAGRTVNYLFLGQLEKHKGLLFLLEVFAEFSKKHPVKLYIAGKGSLEKEIKTRYVGAPWLEFLGYVPYENLPDIFKKIHYTVVPSLCYENSPGVIFDSFKFGSPVVASCLGGIPEFVKEGATGFLFEPGNKVNFLNQLGHSFSSMEHFALMSENARMKAREYDIRKYIYKILNM